MQTDRRRRRKNLRLERARLVLRLPVARHRGRAVDRPDSRRHTQGSRRRGPQGRHHPADRLPLRSRRNSLRHRHQLPPVRARARHRDLSSGEPQRLGHTDPRARPGADAERRACMKRIAIIGGGISGLTCAYELELARKGGAPIDWHLYEASDRLGGIIETTRHSTPEGNYILEGGPDGWVTEKPWARDLAIELGLESELICSSDATRKTY